MGPVIYGTKGKGDRTATLVEEAIIEGFRHLASASSHYNNYNEDAVGRGWKNAALSIGLKRKDLFLQTMFISGSNPDWKSVAESVVKKDAPVAEQVRASIEESLRDLRTEYLDAVLYHNLKNVLDPLEDVLEAWAVMESYVDAGKVRHLGITNVYDLQYFDKFYNGTRIKPTIVQNRFHANRQFGPVHLRKRFRELGITEQLFWVLTGNGSALKHPATKKMAVELDFTPQQCLYAFILAMGGGWMHPLIGTTSRVHMKQDLEVAKRFSTDNFGGSLFPQKGMSGLQEYAREVFKKPELIVL